MCNWFKSIIHECSTRVYHFIAPSSEDLPRSSEMHCYRIIFFLKLHTYILLHWFDAACFSGIFGAVLIPLKDIITHFLKRHFSRTVSLTKAERFVQRFYLKQSEVNNTFLWERQINLCWRSFNHAQFWRKTKQNNSIYVTI